MENFQEKAEQQFADLCSRLKTVWLEALGRGKLLDSEALVRLAREGSCAASLHDTPDACQVPQTVDFTPGPASETNHGTGHANVTVDFPSPPADPAATQDGVALRAKQAGPPSATVDFAPVPDTDFSLDPPQSNATLDYAASSVEPKATMAPVSEGGTSSVRASDSSSVAGYEILGVLGRGAMGVVYKARQRGLKRIVALKMILAGEHAEERELARFRIEAEAVARLQHPNIVQVYEVGEQAGNPFLSLEYVDGGSLKEKLAGKPQPVQHAAQMVQVLAQAMGFAHRQGIIHRDLKPANVMLMKPRPAGSTESGYASCALVEELYGTPKIADFGLAKRLEEDTGQTRSGTILGTPAYMAPEQAEGRSKEVGPLADLYALGAILYELLTGRPPFQGSTVWETLDQVRTQEPVPPSRLQPKVPRDLETICLKCLQKEPHKRYGDTVVLAEDLRRFVSGEPILARPVSALERGYRWCRRYPRTAGLVGALSLTVVLFVVSLFFYNLQLRHEKAETEKQRQDAVTARDLADQRKDEAVKAKNEAEENSRIAQEQRKLALNALGEMVTNAQTELRGRAGTEDLQKKLAELAMQKLQLVSEKGAAKVSLKDATLAAAHKRLGDLFLELGDTQQATKELQQAHDIFELLARTDPTSSAAKGNQALVLLKLGEVSLKRQGQVATALGYYQHAADLLESIEKEPSDGKVPPRAVKSLLTDTFSQIGTVIADSNPTEARKYYDKALQYRLQLAQGEASANDRRGLAHAYLLLGGIDQRLRNPVAARDNYRKALEIHEALAKADPKQLPRQRDLAFNQQRLGDLYLRTARLDDADKCYRKALEVYQQLVELAPKNTLYQGDLARVHYDIASTALRRGDRKAAADHYRESLRLREILAKGNDTSALRDLMTTLARCGETARAIDLAQRLTQSLANETAVLFDVACCYAICRGLATEGTLREHYTAQALESLRQAVSHGYKDVVSLETEPDLDSLREQPNFQAFLTELRRRLAQ
jgi:serine/threonine-protein kinase